MSAVAAAFSESSHSDPFERCHDVGSPRWREGGEQGRGAVAFVVVCHRAGATIPRVCCHSLSATCIGSMLTWRHRGPRHHDGEALGDRRSKPER